MTDRYNTVTVVFENEIREDDLEHWINAIGMLRKVIKVVPGELNSFDGGREQAKHEFRMAAYAFLKEWGG